MIGFDWAWASLINGGVGELDLTIFRWAVFRLGTRGHVRLGLDIGICFYSRTEPGYASTQRDLGHDSFPTDHPSKLKEKK